MKIEYEINSLNRFEVTLF